MGLGQISGLLAVTGKPSLRLPTKVSSRRYDRAADSQLAVSLAMPHPMAKLTANWEKPAACLRRFPVEDVTEPLAHDRQSQSVLSLGMT